MNLTNLFGKQVFALYEGEIIGTVVDAKFNQNLTKVIALKLFNDEETEFELKFANIYSFGDCVLVSNTSKLTPFFEGKKTTPFLKAVIGKDAKNYGYLVDCNIDPNGNIQNFITNLGTALSPNCLYVRNKFVYYTEGNFKGANFKPKNKVKSLESIRVNILQDDQMPDNFAPTKITFNPSSIIGKVAKDTLFGANNEIIIKTNQIISQKTIAEATRHNRLNQLYFIAV